MAGGCGQQVVGTYLLQLSSFATVNSFPIDSSTSVCIPCQLVLIAVAAIMLNIQDNTYYF